MLDLKNSTSHTVEFSKLLFCSLYQYFFYCQKSWTIYYRESKNTHFLKEYSGEALYTLGWSDLPLLAFFEIGHLAANQVHFYEFDSTKSAKLSIKKNQRSLKNEKFCRQFVKIFLLLQRKIKTFEFLFLFTKVKRRQSPPPPWRRLQKCFYSIFRGLI